MGLNQTAEAMKRYLKQLLSDLDKAGKGNESAAQRVRTSSIALAKISKQYRKESIAATKKKRAKKL